jgi:hypothetical protein
MLYVLPRPAIRMNQGIEVPVLELYRSANPVLPGDFSHGLDNPEPMGDIALVVVRHLEYK